MNSSENLRECSSKGSHIRSHDSIVRTGVGSPVCPWAWVFPCVALKDGRLCSTNRLGTDLMAGLSGLSGGLSGVVQSHHPSEPSCSSCADMLFHADRPLSTLASANVRVRGELSNPAATEAVGSPRNSCALKRQKPAARRRATACLKICTQPRGKQRVTSGNYGNYNQNASNRLTMIEVIYVILCGSSIWIFKWTSSNQWVCPCELLCRHFSRFLSLHCPHFADWAAWPNYEHSPNLWISALRWTQQPGKTYHLLLLLLLLLQAQALAPPPSDAEPRSRLTCCGWKPVERRWSSGIRWRQGV